MESSCTPGHRPTLRSRHLQQLHLHFPGANYRFVYIIIIIIPIITFDIFYYWQIICVIQHLG